MLVRAEENTGIPEMGYNQEENLGKLCNNYLLFENDGLIQLKGVECYLLGIVEP